MLMTYSIDEIQILFFFRSRDRGIDRKHDLCDWWRNSSIPWSWQQCLCQPCRRSELPPSYWCANYLGVPRPYNWRIPSGKKWTSGKTINSIYGKKLLFFAWLNKDTHVHMFTYIYHVCMYIYNCILSRDYNDSLMKFYDQSVSGKGLSIISILITR